MATARFVTGSRIEVVHPERPYGKVRAVLFDFDGTLSLIREGWPEVMIPMMVEVLQATPRAESTELLRQHVEEFVMRLNGKQTIYQMIQLADEVRARGGEPLEPLAYKHEYHTRLLARIQHRLDGLANGSVDPESLTVPGSRELLTELKRLGLPLVLASGTDLMFVKRELAALQLHTFFGDQVFGALDNHTAFSKKMIIERLHTEYAMSEGELLAFGDGYVETEETRKIGGIAVGVASDESHRVGINEWKRNRLIGAGADLIVPDYRDLKTLIETLRLS